MVKGLCTISYHPSPPLNQWFISVILQSITTPLRLVIIVHSQILNMRVFQLFKSVSELLWKVIWQFSPNDSHKWLNQENIFVIKKCDYINLFGGQSLTTVLSLEHLISMTHTGLLQSIHSTPSFPPAALIPGGRGACILHLVRVGIWIGLSLLEQSRAVAHLLPVLIWLWQ